MLDGLVTVDGVAWSGVEPVVIDAGASADARYLGLDIANPDAEHVVERAGHIVLRVRPVPRWLESMMRWDEADPSSAQRDDTGVWCRAPATIGAPNPPCRHARRR